MDSPVTVSPTRCLVVGVWESDGYRYLPGTRPWQMGEFEAITCPCGAGTNMYALRLRKHKLFGDHFGSTDRLTEVLNKEHNERRQQEMESWQLVPR